MKRPTPLPGFGRTVSRFFDGTSAEKSDYVIAAIFVVVLVLMNFKVI